MPSEMGRRDAAPRLGPAERQDIAAEAVRALHRLARARRAELQERPPRGWYEPEPKQLDRLFSIAEGLPRRSAALHCMAELAEVLPDPPPPRWFDRFRERAVSGAEGGDAAAGDFLRCMGDRWLSQSGADLAAHVEQCARSGSRLGLDPRVAQHVPWTCVRQADALRALEAELDALH